MSVRGIFASHSGIVGDRQQDLAGRVLMTMPGGSAPLLALSSGMPSERASDTAFSWIEDSHITGNTTVNGTVNSSATSVVVGDANVWTPNTIIMNEVTGEHILITAISGNTCTIVRGIGGTTAATLTNNDTLQSIGTAHAEGSGKPDPVAQRGQSITNYVQIFKNGWAITGTAEAIDFTTGSQLALNKEQCFAYHAEDIERAFLWGKKDVRVISNKQLRLTNGVLAQISQSGGLVEAANIGGSGQMSLKGLQNFFRRIFDYRVKGMPNERIAFTGSGVVELIQNMALRDGTYNIEANETSWGIQIVKLNFFNGSVTLMVHPLMIENAIWQKELYVLHPGLIKKRVLRDSWSEEFSPKKQNNAGLDATEGYLAIEMGVETKGARTMGVMTNIATAVASFS